MTAVELSGLLADRHKGDVFVPECKMGPAGSRSLDAWALLPTWSPLTSIGYEVKVSRSDWLRDQKFEEYRTCCHLFYVVASPGVVTKAELPTGVGLLEPIGTGDGRRLVTRVKAVRSDVDVVKLHRLMAYALMWRRGILDDPGAMRSLRSKAWARFVDDRERFHSIGHSVKGRMRLILAEALDAKAKAEARANLLEWTQEMMTELGVVPGYDRWSCRRNVQDAIERDGGKTVKAIKAAIESLQSLHGELSGARDHVA